MCLPLPLPLSLCVSVCVSVCLSLCVCVCVRVCVSQQRTAQTRQPSAQSAVPAHSQSGWHRLDHRLDGL